MKKGVGVALCIAVLFVNLVFAVNPEDYTAHAAETPNQSVEESLKETTGNQLDTIDMGSLEDFYLSLEDTTKINKSPSVKEIIASIISGEYTMEYSSVFDMIATSLKEVLKNYLPALTVIIAIVFLISLTKSIKPQSSDGVGNIIDIAGFSAVAFIVVKLLLSLLQTSIATVNTLSSQMNITFPIILTLMVAVGGNVSAKIYQPAVAMLANGMVTVFQSLLIPIFIFSVAFTVISNLSPSIKLSKSVSFLNSLFKWVVGVCFTIFIGFLSVQGITASTVDGVSIKTAKYAIKNYVPILGGYLSDGFEVIRAGSMLIKNGLGLTSIIILAGIIITPLLSILVLSLGLKLVSALVQPVADSKLTNFLASSSKLLTMLSVIIIGISLMFFISVVLMISTANFQA